MEVLVTLTKVETLFSNVRIKALIGITVFNFLKYEYWTWIKSMY